jgi:hypothetical protein
MSSIGHYTPIGRYTLASVKSMRGRVVRQRPELTLTMGKSRESVCDSATNGNLRIRARRLVRRHQRQRRNDNYCRYRKRRNPGPRCGTPAVRNVEYVGGRIALHLFHIALTQVREKPAWPKRRCTSKVPTIGPR